MLSFTLTLRFFFYIVSTELQQEAHQHNQYNTINRLAAELKRRAKN